MNILTVSPVYNPTCGAGITMVIKNICIRLEERGHHCKILTINRESSDDMNELINGVEIKRIGSPGSKYFYGLSPAMYRHIRSDLTSWLRRDHIDIIHIHMYHNLLSLQLIFQIRNCGKPLIFTPHYNGPGHTQFKSLLLRLYQPLGRQIFKRVDKVVCTSEYEAMLVRKDFSVSEEVIKVIPHGVNMTHIKSHRKKASESSHISMLFVGRLEEHKGIQYVLRAMQQLKDAYHMQPVLDIVGGGPYKKHLVKLATKLDLEDNVIWSGVLEQKALWQQYKDTDIFLLPSRWECYGLVAAEALASGTPVIVCDTSALSEFVTETGCFGIKYPPQPEELARLIVDIHKSDVQVGPLNPTKIRTWDKVADEYQNIYTEVINA